MIRIAPLLALVVLMSLLTAPMRAAEPVSGTVRFKFSGPGTEMVTSPTFSKAPAVAIDVRSKTGSKRLTSTAPRFEAGRYRVTVNARLHQTPRDDISRLRVDFVIGSLGGGSASGGGSLGGSQKIYPAVWTQFDASSGRLTPLTFEVASPRSFSPTIDVNWQVVANSAVDRARSVRPEEPPEAPKLADKRDKPKPALGDDDLLRELENEQKATPLAKINYPAVIVDSVQFERIAAEQYVERVRPQFVHIYPEQANPIDVEIRNLASRPVKATVKLEVLTGLDEVLHAATKEVTLAAGSITPCHFDWIATKREFGHEARVTLMVDGRPVHQASDYFSVSFPIWKTALQASGFLTWVGREPQFPEHIAYNRAQYLNVEEAFSWQPSSWTDLTPKDDHWWSGQGDAHNNVSGLKTWIDGSHAHGIKMITYLWPSASGPTGIDWARENPELVTHVEVGLAAEFFDVEDLRLQPLTKANPKLWRLRSGVWSNLGINRGMLRAIDKGMREVVASAERFGWDGVRFDAPPAWSAMGADLVHSEFKELKIAPLMKKLVPEYYEQTTGNWSGDAISVRNIRYARHLLHEHNPRFALSFNFGAQVDVPPGKSPFFDACCAEGGQVMDEEIRNGLGGNWPAYLKRIREQANIARQRGGYHCVVAPDASSALTRAYAAICTFAGGSHPYLDYGWAQPLPGTYTQFMTRFGEYCWSLDLAPAPADAAKFTLSDEKLWWRDLVRHRVLPDGRHQWVVHLISPPPDSSATQASTMSPWRRDLSLSRTTSQAPTVWLLSAEPVTHAVQLPTERSGDRFQVKIPEHRLWSLLVWTEPGNQ